jgi:nicotine oxidoreductase
MDCDAVVVGGGFAGVTAARELQSAGMETVLLEARDRLGGRTWTVEFAGQRVEMGGTWMHWQQPHVWAELTRYDIPIVEDNWTYDAALFGQPPRRHPAEQAFAKVNGLFSEYAAADRSILPLPHDPLHAASKLAERDALSMQDRLEEMGMPEADRDWITGLLYEIAGAPLDEAGLMPVLRWMALCDWNIDKWYDTNRYRPVGGTAAVIGAMLADGRVDVRLSSPVSAVEVSDHGVKVTTQSGETVSARVGVVATPVNLWSTIDFRPGLPRSHQEVATAGMGKPHMDKVFIHARGDIGRVFAQLPYPKPLGFFWTYHEEGDAQLIFGINASPELDVNDKEQVAATIRGYVPEIEEVLDVTGHAWGSDPFSRGGNTCYRPGQLTRYLADLQQPVGRLAFAGADLASGWVGYMDGAVESGLRAARMCLR